MLSVTILIKLTCYLFSPALSYFITILCQGNLIFDEKTVESNNKLFLNHKLFSNLIFVHLIHAAS